MNYQSILEDIYKDIDRLASVHPTASRVFLADGDVLGIDTTILIDILEYLQNSFKKLRRVSTYASTQNIQNNKQAR